ncbi:MAG: putative urea ABC transporter substrate-binding protein [Nanoarchaeota archaeon]|nr:putative urea ABC transporter substrate-binding protein [Nanoarchaeota archaeon]
MKKFKPVLLFILAFLFLSLNIGANHVPVKKQKVKIAWSIYAGWQPWDFAYKSGIVKKWGEKYGLDIELLRMDYIPSIEAYVSGQVDGVVMTNMETLGMPCVAKVTTTSLLMGDFSNGSDKVLTRDGLKMKDIKQAMLTELSVSQYLLNRGLEKNGMKESDVQILNTIDSDIEAIFTANKSQKVVVTWNPMAMNILKEVGVRDVFNSSEIPGEILDLLCVNTKKLEKNPNIGKALVGAWYEVMGIMTKRNKESQKALEIMSESAGCSVGDYKAQLKTTAMFYTPKEAAEYTESQELKTNMDRVRKFCFEHDLLGEKAKSVDEIGIRYPDGSVQGDKENVQFIFDSYFMRLAEQGKL